MNEFNVGDKVRFAHSPLNHELIYTIECIDSKGFTVGIDVPTPSGSTYHHSYELSFVEWDYVLNPVKVADDDS